MRHLLRVILLGLLLCASCVGCKEAPPTPTSPPPKPTVYDVGWQTLVRDFQTASSYKGYRVRIRLEPWDYMVESGEIHVWINNNGAPPVLVFRDPNPLPLKPYPAISVVGFCQGPVRDGHWRGRSIDFVVTVSDCAVTVR